MDLGHRFGHIDGKLKDRTIPTETFYNFLMKSMESLTLISRRYSRTEVNKERHDTCVEQ